MAANPNRTRYMDRDGIPSFTESPVYQDPRQLAAKQLAYVTETIRYILTGTGSAVNSPEVCPVDPAEVEIVVADGSAPVQRKIVITPAGVVTSVNMLTGAAGSASDFVLNADGTFTIPAAILANAKTAIVIVNGYRKNTAVQD